jgi:hypothetical protein
MALTGPATQKADLCAAAVAGYNGSALPAEHQRVWWQNCCNQREHDNEGCVLSPHPYLHVTVQQTTATGFSYQAQTHLWVCE